MKRNPTCAELGHADLGGGVCGWCGDPTEEPRRCEACGEECDRAEGICDCPDECPIPAAGSNR